MVLLLFRYAQRAGRVAVAACVPAAFAVFLFCIFKRFVDSSLYLAFQPFPAEAALGREIIKVSILQSSESY